jgi:NTE family protein
VGTKALVLGGGGVTGVAWELGVLQGLATAGVDVAAADLVVGTSAGALVGAHVACGVDLDELVDAQFAAARSGDGAGADVDMDQLVTAFLAAIDGAAGGQEIRARLGAMALAAETVPEEERIAVLSAVLPATDWPERRLLVTGVDAGNGDFVAWDRDSGVPLRLAVAASCAVPGVWPPVTIGGRRYMDGGVRTVTNVDLAAGHDVILVLAPIPGPGLASPGVEQEAEPLRERSRVLVVAPDAAAAAALGPNPLDASRRAEALQAGRQQGGTVADQVRPAWTS